MNDSAWVELESKITTCRKCPRLVAWREEVARIKRRAFRGEEYWGKPVPGFGDHSARLLVVGLAPGAHGSNRTGRMFTGDASGDFLYPALFQAGFSNQTNSHSLLDELSLRDLFITAVCRCAPPDNKPSTTEITTCFPYLRDEFHMLPLQGIVALGKIAYEWSLRLIQESSLPLTKPPAFGHGILYEPEGSPLWLLTSYHPSRQNTQTGRLTKEMFASIWIMAKDRLNASSL